MYAFIAQLLEPYTFLLLSLALLSGGAWRSTRPRRRWLAWGCGLVALLFMLSMPVVGELALGSLEWSYPETAERPATDDTLIVLGGSLVTESAADRRVRLGNTTITRCLHARRLYDQAGGCRMILAGGRMFPKFPQASLAATMRDFLVEIGVSADDLVLEEESTTTWENAAKIKPLVERASPSRYWLVTEAAHMRRAEKCFQAQRIPVIPAPCGHRAQLAEIEPRSFLPTSDGIAQVDHTVHEWLGILWYWLRGRI